MNYEFNRFAHSAGPLYMESRCNRNLAHCFFLVGVSAPGRKFFGTACGPFGVLSCLRIVQADVKSFSEGF